MTDTTSQTGTVDAPMSLNDGIGAIENLLADDPETDLVPTGEAKSEAKASDEAPEGDDDEPDLVLEDDEADTSGESEAKDPPSIGDDYMVALPDGQTITLGELKRNNLFQRDYSRKTEELARERERLDHEFQQRMSQAEQELHQRRALIFELSNQLIPEEPSLELLRDDPLGYQEQRAIYEYRMRQFHQLQAQKEAEEQAMQRQKAERDAELLAQEREKVFQVLPKLKDEKRMEAFKADVGTYAVNHYRFTPEELGGLNDHRMLQVMHDAIQYRKALERTTKVKEEVTAKPRLEVKQRMNPQTVRQRDQQGRFEAHRQNRSIDTAAKLIETLI